MSNLHKDLNDSQLHVPKGFAGASDSTICTKDASGNLVWAADSSVGRQTINFTFRGQRTAKTTGEYRVKYTAKMIGAGRFGEDSTAVASTPTPYNAMEYGRYVVPADCTITSITTRSTASDASLECSLYIYLLRYDCSTTPTTITETLIHEVMSEELLAVGEINCKNITSGFTTSALLKGDILAVYSEVDAVTSHPFTYQGSMLMSID